MWTMLAILNFTNFFIYCLLNNLKVTLVLSELMRSPCPWHWNDSYTFNSICISFSKTNIKELCTAKSNFTNPLVNFNTTLQNMIHRNSKFLWKITIVTRFLKICTIYKNPFSGESHVTRWNCSQTSFTRWFRTWRREEGVMARVPDSKEDDPWRTQTFIWKCIWLKKKIQPEIV